MVTLAPPARTSAPAMGGKPSTPDRTVTVKAGGDGAMGVSGDEPVPQPAATIASASEARPECGRMDTRHQTSMRVIQPDPGAQ